MEEDAARRLAVFGRAPELVGVNPWFNTPNGEPLRLAALRDRVVLLDFWTFACVNCQRTLPFLRRMHDQYQPDFTVVGVHSPSSHSSVPFRTSSVPCGTRAEISRRAGQRFRRVERVWKPVLANDVPHRSRRPDSLHQIGEAHYRRTETAIRTVLAEAGGPAAGASAASGRSLMASSLRCGIGLGVSSRSGHSIAHTCALWLGGRLPRLGEGVTLMRRHLPGLARRCLTTSFATSNATAWPFAMEPSSSSCALEEQSEPHNQPRAHRRGLLAQTHNLLWVKAARHILVAWKAPHLARTNAVRMAVEATERTRQADLVCRRRALLRRGQAPSTLVHGPAGGGPEPEPAHSRPGPLQPALTRHEYPVAPRRSLGRRPSAVSSAPRRRSQRIRPTAGAWAGGGVKPLPRQHRNTP